MNNTTCDAEYLRKMTKYGNIVQIKVHKVCIFRMRRKSNLSTLRQSNKESVDLFDFDIQHGCYKE